MDEMNSIDGIADSCLSHDTLNGLRETVGDETLVGLISMYMDESEQILADIDRAMDDNDLQALERHVHLLKGVSANFGMVKIVAGANAAMAACRERRPDNARITVSSLSILTQEAKAALKEFSARLS